MPIKICRECGLRVLNNYLADFVTEFTVYPRAGTWLFDEEEIERTKRCALERSVLRLGDLCQCKEVALKGKWIRFLFGLRRDYRCLKDDSER
jgi:hypothetical protein